MADGHMNNLISMPFNWAKERWVMIYIFSDQSANLFGYGAYASGVGSEYFEERASGSFNMDTFAGSYKMRIGSRNDNIQPVSNLRKLLIFKGTAIHASSTTHSINDLLESELVNHLGIDCPQLLATLNPAC